MALTSKRFGLVTVWTDEGGVFSSKPSVSIDWACTGENTLKKAQKFHNDFTEALIFAAQEEKRLGIKNDN